MSKNTVYPWWQVASDIAASKDWDDAALEELARDITQRKRDRISQRARLAQAADDLLRSEGITHKSIMNNVVIDDEVDKDGNDPVQVAAETQLSQCIYRALKDGSLQAYYSYGRPMQCSVVLTRGIKLEGVCVEPVSVNALLKAAGYLDVVWVPGTVEDHAVNAPEVTQEAPQDNNLTQRDAIESDLAALFDGMSYNALDKMFPSDGSGWKQFTERAKRNGLATARTAWGEYNPLLAALWWLRVQKPVNWDQARVYRTLAKNLPPRSKGLEHLLTGNYD